MRCTDALSYNQTKCKQMFSTAEAGKPFLLNTVLQFMTCLKRMYIYNLYYCNDQCFRPSGQLSVQACKKPFNIVKWVQRFILFMFITTMLCTQFCSHATAASRCPMLQRGNRIQVRHHTDLQPLHRPSDERAGLGLIAWLVTDMSTACHVRSSNDKR